MLKAEKWLTRLLCGTTSLLIVMFCSGCQGPPPEAYITKVGDRYVLNAMPCNPESFTGVYAGDRGESSDGEPKFDTHWEATLTGDSPVNTLTLFGENPGYKATALSKPRIDTEVITIGFEMERYNLHGTITGVLSSIGSDEALTSRGVVPISEIGGWRCG